MNNRRKEYSTGKQTVFGIRAKMLTVFGLIFVVIFMNIQFFEIYDTPFLGHKGKYSQYKDDAFRNLNNIADLKKERLSRWLVERRGNARLFSENNVVLPYIAEILSLSDGIKANEENAWSELKGNQSYQDLLQAMLLMKKAYGSYNNMWVINVNTGQVIASTRARDLGTDVSSYDFFSDVVQSEGHELIDLYNTPFSNESKLYISCTICLDGNSNISSAVFIMEINSDDFLLPLLHTGKGLGETGEVVLVNRDSLILAPLKFPLKSGEYTKPLECKISAKPAVLASGGKDGFVQSEDYRGEMVFAAHRYVPLIPGNGWGMVVKIDKREVFAQLNKNMIFVLKISIIGIAIVLGCSFLVANRLSRSVRKLKDTTALVKKYGNLSVRAVVNSRDEIGALSIAFNEMIERIDQTQKELQNHRDNLEEMVVKRTSELDSTNKKLEDEIEKKKLAHQILENAEKLAHMGSWNYDIHNDRLECSDEVYNIFGIDKESFSFKYQSYLDFVHPDDREFVDRSINKAMDQSTKYDYDEIFRVVNASGTERILRSKAKVTFDVSGKPVEMCGTLQDVTELTQAENELHKLSQAVEQSPVSIIITDKIGNIEYVNPKFTKITGYIREEVIGKNPRILKSGEKSPDEYKELWKAITAGKEWKGNFHNRRKSGELYWENALISSLKNKHGEITHFIGIKEDITEQKTIENKLRISYKMATLGRLASGIFHEVLNPVNIISSHVQLLLMEAEKGSTTEEDLKSIQEEIKRIVDISDGLLRFSRKGTSDSEKTEMNDLLERTISIVEPDMKLNNIGFDRKFDDNLLPIIASKDRLRQVFLNLINNARDAMPEGGAITVSTENIEQGEVPFVRIEIKDTGDGIDKDKINLIFNPFFTTKTEGKGTGLGLSTSYDIIENHGGVMSVDTEVGKGTTFTIDLPVKY